MGAHTTIRFPVELPVEARGGHWYAQAGERMLRLSNLNKVFWPTEGFTKGDLLTYYFNISPVMLPHLVDRPLTLKRMPDGIGGAYFYEKNAPAHTPEWMPRLPTPSTENPSKIINYLTVRDVAHVLWVANLGCIEFHPLHARGENQKRPSYAFFDLDPMGGAGWEEVREVADLVRAALDRTGVASYPKTSGATGMQVMIPLDGSHDYDEVRGFVGTVADLIHDVEPKKATVEWEISKRGSKVFLDVNMNREGANIAAAYSVRPLSGAPVSTPFRWDELDHIHPSDWTMATIFERVAELGDVFLPVAQGPGQNLSRVITELGATPRKARMIRR